VHTHRDDGITGLGAALTALALAELATTGQIAGVVAACRGIVLVALPTARRGVRAPDLVAAAFAGAGLAIDQTAAASRYAPQLVGSTHLRGLHLVAAMLVGSAAVIIGVRARQATGVAMGTLGVAAVLLGGGAAHSALVQPWYTGLLVAQALCGAALALAGWTGRHDPPGAAPDDRTRYP
jgi:hypothetical protein